jgi:hypothetical protein
MEPTTSRTGITGAGQTADEQNLSPQTNVNQTANRANTNRGTTQEGVSFGGPEDQMNRQQSGQGNANST